MEEQAEIVAALLHAQGVGSLPELVVSLSHDVEELRQQLAAAHDREAAVRAALQDTQRRATGMSTQVMHLTGSVAAAEARVRAAQAERDEARAAEDTARKSEAATLRRLQLVEAKLAAASVATPPRVVQVESVGQAEPAVVRQWVRQSRNARAWHDVPAERYAADDAAALRRQVWRLLRQPSGKERAVLVDRAHELLRSLGGA